MSSCRAAIAAHHEPGTCGSTPPAILFPPSSVTFDPAEADRVAGMLACLDQTEGTQLELLAIGHGTPDEGHDVEQRRADAVIRYLADCGVPNAGLTGTYADHTPANARARRVDWVIRSRRP